MYSIYSLMEIKRIVKKNNVYFQIQLIITITNIITLDRRCGFKCHCRNLKLVLKELYTQKFGNIEDPIIH